MRLAILLPCLLALRLGAASGRTGTEGPPQDVAYCQLTNDPSVFAGKRIRIRAIYSYMFEISRLRPPICCSGHDAPVWVEFSDNLDRESTRLYHKFPKGMGFVLAVFTGVLETRGPYGDGGYRAKLAVDRIEKLEATSSGSGHRVPAWVPKDCEASNPAPPKQARTHVTDFVPWVLSFGTFPV